MLAGGLETPVGGAPAGVVEPPRLNRGFAGVAEPAAAVLFEDEENKDEPALFALPNNPLGWELGALVVGVEALFWPPSNPPENAFVVGVDEGFAALVVGVDAVCPNRPPEEAGLAPPPKMFELGVAA